MAGAPSRWRRAQGVSPGLRAGAGPGECLYRRAGRGDRAPPGQCAGGTGLGAVLPCGGQGAPRGGLGRPGPGAEATGRRPEEAECRAPPAGHTSPRQRCRPGPGGWAGPGEKGLGGLGSSLGGLGVSPRRAQGAEAASSALAGVSSSVAGRARQCPSPCAGHWCGRPSGPGLRAGPLAAGGTRRGWSVSRDGQGAGAGAGAPGLGGRLGGWGGQPGQEGAQGGPGRSLQLPGRGCGQRGSGSAPREQGTGPEETAPSCTGGLARVLGKTSALQGCSGTGTGCPGKWLSHHPGCI